MIFSIIISYFSAQMYFRRYGKQKHAFQKFYQNPFKIFCPFPGADAAGANVFVDASGDGRDFIVLGCMRICHQGLNVVCPRLLQFVIYTLQLFFWF